MTNEYGVDLNWAFTRCLKEAEEHARLSEEPLDWRRLWRQYRQLVRPSGE